MYILSTLTLIFIVLKVAGVIDWSWWLVCLPTAIEVVISVVVIWGFKKLLEKIAE